MRVLPGTRYVLTRPPPEHQPAQYRGRTRIHLVIDPHCFTRGVQTRNHMAVLREDLRVHVHLDTPERKAIRRNDWEGEEGRRVDRA